MEWLLVLPVQPHKLLTDVSAILTSTTYKVPPCKTIAVKFDDLAVFFMKILQTQVCPKCNNTGIIFRAVSTSQTTGYIKLRYSPESPKFCSCFLKSLDKYI